MHLRSRFGLVFALAAGLALAAALAAATAPSALPGPGAPQLPAAYQQFLREVDVLMTPAERQLFLGLNRDYQRAAFVRRFWEVRDPFPQTPKNEFRDRFEERLAVVRQRYEELTDDRARVLLLLDAPHRTDRSRCSDVVRPLELWFYDNLPFARPFALIFVGERGADPRGRHRLWSPREGLSALASFGSFVGLEGQPLLARLATECSGGDNLVSALGSAADFDEIRARMPGLSPPSDEWVRAFEMRSTDVASGAALLPATLTLDFAGRHQSRTVVRGLLTVPRAAASPATVGSQSSYAFVIDGEVLRGEELFDQFRYRFDFPSARLPGDSFPLLFQRALRPGPYHLVLRLEDVNGRRFFRDERDLEVPLGAEAPPPPLAASAASAYTEALAAVTGTAATLKLLPPTDALATGRLRVEARTSGEGIARIAFALDGQTVLTKARPPWSVELDLGRAPKMHSVGALAFDAQGHEIARDEVVVNGGPHRFAARLLEPHTGAQADRSLRAVAEIEVPEGEELDRVEFFLDDTRLATLYQPPFAQPLLLPQPGALAWVRVVATLASGLAAEDTAVINTPPGFEQVAVDLVELYTSVLDGAGRPLEGLTAGEFVVKEDGKPQELARFERVRDLPIHATLMIDTSSSMLEKLAEAERAAYGFLTGVLSPHDRAALITFADKPHLAVRFTGNLEVLAGGLAGLTTEGETALYDSVVFGLHYMSGVRGKRALVLLTDGEDTRSRYPFEDVLDFARRTGVAIYAVGLDLPAKAPEVKMRLEQLTHETGGQLFLAHAARELAGIYARIQEDLRSQYLLVYQSPLSTQHDRFRSVEVEVKRHGAKAKTIRGYYPR